MGRKPVMRQEFKIEVMNYIMSLSEKWTSADVAKHFKVKTHSIRYAIATLEKEGKITNVGSKRTPRNNSLTYIYVSRHVRSKPDICDTFYYKKPLIIHEDARLNGTKTGAYGKMSHA